MSTSDGLPGPPAYRDVVPALVAAGVLDQSFATRLSGIAGLRNMLVNDHVTVDEARVRQVLDDHLDDLGRRIRRSVDCRS